MVFLWKDICLVIRPYRLRDLPLTPAIFQITPMLQAAVSAWEGPAATRAFVVSESVNVIQTDRQRSNPELTEKLDGLRTRERDDEDVGT